MNRKRFIFIILSFAGLFFSAPVFSQLTWPSVNNVMRPWTRWWWMGSAVDRKNLTVNMERYRAAGLGGLELTPIYGAKGHEDQFIDYLSPSWMNMLGFTLQEARRLGLGLDMSAGTGWPFGGGPLIDSNDACKEFFYKTWTVRAGQGLADTVQYIQEPLVHTDGYPKPNIGELKQPISANQHLQALALDQVRFAQPLVLQTLMAFSAQGQVLDLTSAVSAYGRLGWTAPESGDWTLYAIFQGAHGKMVERAAPGAEGNVIDHFSAVALRKYLSRFDTAWVGRDLPGLRCFFNDSYEVDDARGQGNWTPGFFERFMRHRGYDLRQHLPALFGKDTKANNDRILCDYRETISDLLLEEFTQPWRDWAHGKGSLIRNQAHGSPANILDLYAASDIPETEGGEILRSKFATSAAHVMGKRLASAETATWLNEHFLSTYSDVRKAADNFLLGGVNHIFYHGTAYSPEGEPWPGWLFYAAVHFTPNDPSWQNFPTLNGYITRCQSFLQQGTSDNDLLLYYPLYDSWSDRGSALLKHYDKMEPEFNGSGFADCATRLQKSGYAFDYISDKQVQGISPDSTRSRTVAKGSLAPGTADVGLLTSAGIGYKTLLLPACHYISAEAFGKLFTLADKGATILIYKALPVEVPGWRMDGQNEFKNLSTMIKFGAADPSGTRRAVVGKGAFLMSDDLSHLLAASHLRREEMVDDSLDFVRRKVESGTVYFIVNHASRPWKGNVSLSVPVKAAAMYDPMTGRTGRAAVSTSPHDLRSRPYLQLDPGETCLLQTFDKPITGPVFPWYRQKDKPVKIEGKWKVEFVAGGPTLPGTVEVDRLGSWTNLGGEEVRRFSGTAKYTTSFARPAGHATAWRLDLGKVDATAQVLLNGHAIATLIGPKFGIDLPDSLIQSQNLLELQVSNLMVNRIEDMDRNGTVWKKFYNTNFPAHERENRGANGLFDASKWTPVDSGLSGPVTLTPLEGIK